jgi:o-succinylbenzoate synthase
MKAQFKKRILRFKIPAGTSRGILMEKPSWYIFLSNTENPFQIGIGECSIIPGLSFDTVSLIEQKLTEICESINAGSYNFKDSFSDFPAIAFGLETALLDYKAKGSKILFASDFTRGAYGIKTNGLIWMGSLESMQAQIEKKLEKGFSCIKIKIGAINFDQEMLILRNLRRRFNSKDLIIRVDANGAFLFDEAKEILKKLADIEVHSIEQPIAASRVEEMAQLCENPPLPIGLDEALIGAYSYAEKQRLIDQIKPQYLILKPSLLGGFNESNEWINIAKSNKIGWWATSALESNIGLNAIAQWVATLNIHMHQGLGVGNLYKSNVESPLTMVGEKLFYISDKNWGFEFVS